MKHRIRFKRIFCDIKMQALDYPVSAVIELPEQFAATPQERSRLIQLGQLKRDGLMMKFALTSKIYIVAIGYLDEHPLALFEGYRVSPTMEGTRDFCNTLMSHLKLMGDM